MRGVIYKITNVLTGKAYIGLTTMTAEYRFVRHCYKAVAGSSSYLHRAIVKYGRDNFTVVTIKETRIRNMRQLQKLERWAIAEHGTRYPRGYNLTDGGEGAIGWVPSKEWRLRRSKMMTGKKRKPFSEEHRRRIGLASKGRVASIATRRKLSRAAKGKNNSRYGCVVTGETRQKCQLRGINMFRRLSSWIQTDVSL